MSKIANPANLILYRDFENGEILDDMYELMQEIEEEELDEELLRELAETFHSCLNGLAEGAATYGFEGNLWQTYLTYLIVNHENAYSLSTEIRGEIEGSINELALHDFEILRRIFHYPLQEIGKGLGVGIVSAFENYSLSDGQGKAFNVLVKEAICELSKKLAKAENAESFQKMVTDFYAHYGVGKFGLHKAFRLEHPIDEEAEIVPITNVTMVELKDLVGYESAKQKLMDNTEAFVNGKSANNCLLYGDAGTGKSTSIKAIMNQYYDRGLRIIEIYKHQFHDLNTIIEQIKNRNYKFIIYMDDLSFEEFEIEYKYLKAVIEGGLEKKPDNVLIYATSNRRHLIRENFRDKHEKEEDMHTGDTVQEKLSLSARFGLQIYFPSPEKKEFQNIVKEIAARRGLMMSEEELLNKANMWELTHGGFSGRCAEQLIDDLLGKQM